MVGSLLRLSALASCAVCQAPLHHGGFEPNQPQYEGGSVVSTDGVVGVLLGLHLQGLGCDGASVKAVNG